MTRPARPRVVALAQYLSVGVLSVVVDVVLLVVLHDGLGVPLALATATAFAASVVVNFLLNRMLVHGRGSADLFGHVRRYVVLLVANGLLTVVVVTGGAAIGLPYLPVKLAVVAAATAWNFVLYRRWVFAPRPAADMPVIH
jgi:putative flippase GtrA